MNEELTGVSEAELEKEMSNTLAKELRKRELIAELDALTGLKWTSRELIKLDGKLNPNGLTLERVYADGPIVVQRAYVTPESLEAHRVSEWWATYRIVLAPLLSMSASTARARAIARDEANYAHGTIEDAAHMNEVQP